MEAVFTDAVKPVPCPAKRKQSTPAPERSVQSRIARTAAALDLDDSDGDLHPDEFGDALPRPLDDSSPQPWPTSFPTATSPIGVANSEFSIIGCDGSCRSVDGLEQAGWGFTVATPFAEYQIDLAGPVVVDATAPSYIGAAKASNNTAELSALYWALTFVRNSDLKRVEVRYDSTYAYNMTVGRWTPRSNIRLVLACRQALRRIPADFVVTFLHVYGHTGDAHNERADHCAKLGSTLPDAASADTHAIRQLLDDNAGASTLLSLPWR
jgi:ribonuclease HI